MESVLQPLRAYEHWLAQYKRVWRGTIVDQTQNAPGGVPYLDFVAPGLVAAAAMQTATIESTWPVMAAIKWSRVYHAMIATPLTERDAFVGRIPVTRTPFRLSPAAKTVAASRVASFTRGPGDRPFTRPSSTHNADTGVTWSRYALGQAGFQAGPENNEAS